MLFRSLLVAVTAGLATATPVIEGQRIVPRSHVLHERSAPHWAQKWTKRSKVPGEAVIPMRIGLTQSNLQEGHEKLMEISNPFHENYGKHMTSDEVIDFFAPSEKSIHEVMNWLTSSGISKDRIGLSVNKQWIQFDAMTGEVEELLYTDYYIWEHLDGSSDLATEAYHVPVAIQEHIDYITPGTRLRSRGQVSKQDRHAKRSIRDGVKPRPEITVLPGYPNPNSTTCSIYVTAGCTRAQYNMPNGTTAYPGNQLGIFESLDDHYSKHDLDVFFATAYPELHVPTGTYPDERLIDGAIGAVETPSPIYPLQVGLESSLDFDSAWPLIYPQGTVLFQTDDEYYEYTGNFSGFWNTFLDAIDGSYCTYSAYGETGDCTEPECADPVYPDPNKGGYKGKLQCGVYKPTNVISISYGADEPYFPDFYMKRQCNEWMKIVLQGTTIVMSAGDSGVGDPTACPPKPSGQLAFDPDFASTCPYVLSVGSTEWDRYASATGPEKPYEKLNEVATKRFPSGGGFSNVFPRPPWQAGAVEHYLSTTAKTLPFTSYSQFVKDGDFSKVKGAGVYNSLGRAYPDVAAVGDRQIVLANNTWYLVGGTSLSSPVWGSVLTLINEIRLHEKKSTLGFIHPILYAHPEVFNDITSGSNAGCNTTGFVNAKGWDPVSGLGSPNFQKLVNVLTGSGGGYA
ncbi:subtilisin-like protein [Xylariaceae sp. FL0255]|nr:subtilisin-like protein [Xylariaceae sp. FL0255]